MLHHTFLFYSFKVRFNGQRLRYNETIRFRKKAAQCIFTAKKAQTKLSILIPVFTFAGSMRLISVGSHPSPRPMNRDIVFANAVIRWFDSIGLSVRRYWSIAAKTVCLFS